MSLSVSRRSRPFKAFVLLVVSSRTSPGPAVPPLGGLPPPTPAASGIGSLSPLPPPGGQSSSQKCRGRGRSTAAPAEWPPLPSPRGHRRNEAGEVGGGGRESCRATGGREALIAATQRAGGRSGARALHLPRDGGGGWRQRTPPTRAEGEEGGGPAWPGVGRGLGPAPQVLFFPWHPRVCPDGAAPTAPGSPRCPAQAGAALSQGGTGGWEWTW